MKTKSLTNKQIEDLSNYVDNNKEDLLAVFIDIMLTTGCRLDEVCSITPNDVDAFNCRIRIAKPAKNSVARNAPVHQSLCNNLLDIAEARCIKPDQAYVWRITATSVYSAKKTIQLYWRRLRWHLWKQQVVEGVHCLRHTKARRIHEQTKDLYAVKLGLGHKSLQSTEFYMKHIQYENLTDVFVKR